MVVKVKEYFDKTRHVENNDESKKYFLRGQRDTRYHERILSNKIISNNIRKLIISITNTDFVNFLEDGNRYKVQIFRVN